MRKLVTIMACLAFASLPAFGKPPPGTTSRTRAVANGQQPVDVGPFTPDANRAYQGGGVILQGAPGAAAPSPQPTPPGQAPANSVPPNSVPPKSVVR